MKLKTTLFIAVLALIITSCATQKVEKNEALYNTTWELEYISGPRIAFNGLYPDRKPKISFNKATNTVSGNNSCNGYTASFTLTGNSISFGQPGPATLMYCGEGEQVFLNMMKKINNFSIDENEKLILKMDGVAMMHFKKLMN